MGSLSFQEFKRRYYKELESVGVGQALYPSDEKLSEIYIGIAVIKKWEHEEYKKQVKRERGRIYGNAKQNNEGLH